MPLTDRELYDLINSLNPLYLNDYLEKAKTILWELADRIIDKEVKEQLKADNGGDEILIGTPLNAEDNNEYPYGDD